MRPKTWDKLSDNIDHIYCTVREGRFDRRIDYKFEKFIWQCHWQIIQMFYVSISPILSRKMFLIKWSMILKLTYEDIFMSRFFFFFRYFDEITTLTYVLMYNFCPCFILFASREVIWERVQNKNSFVSSSVRFVGGTKNII